MGSLRTLHNIIKQVPSEKAKKLCLALEWRIEKLYRRGDGEAKNRAYAEALDILSNLREEIGYPEEVYSYDKGTRWVL